MIFHEPPEDFDKQLDVVGCFLQHNGRFLLLQRQPEKINGGKWGLPAGKVDDGEERHEALIRELLEETGIEIPKESAEFHSTVYVRNGSFDLVYHMFSVHFPEEPAVCVNDYEHQGHCWVTPEESFAIDLIHDQADCNRLFFDL